MMPKAWIAVTGIAVVMSLGGCANTSLYFPAQVEHSDARNGGFQEDKPSANSVESSPLLGVSFDFRFF